MSEVKVKDEELVGFKVEMATLQEKLRRKIEEVDKSSYRIVVLKRQNCLKFLRDKPKLKVKMQSVSDNDVRKRLLEKPRFELAAKGVFRLGRCYIFRQGVPGLRASNWKSTATDGRCTGSRIVLLQQPVLHASHDTLY